MEIVTTKSDNFATRVKNAGIGIVFPVFNRPHYIRECFASVQKSDNLTHACLVFVHDGHKSNELEELTRGFREWCSLNNIPWINIVKSVNKGIADSLALGWQTLFDASPQISILCSIDTDMIVGPSWITVMESLIKEKVGDSIFTGFHESLVGIHKIKLVKQSYMIKSSFGGAHVFFKRSFWENPNFRAQIQGNSWDWQVVSFCNSNGFDLVCSIPSCVQHIGATGMHSVAGVKCDYALDFCVQNDKDDDYVFLPALDSGLGDIIKRDGNVESLKKFCNGLLAAVGFNSAGWVKHELHLDQLKVYDLAQCRGLHVKKSAWQKFIRLVPNVIVRGPNVQTLDIPKVIHQVWIGPRLPPLKWINTWKVAYMTKFPKWSYRLWRDEDVAALVQEMGDDFVNNDLLQRTEDYAGRVDIIRLNILHRFGGVYIDADSEWINYKGLDSLLERAKESGFFAGQEPPLPGKPKLYANGVMGATAGHWFLDKVFAQQQVLKRTRPGGASWETLGPAALTEAVGVVGAESLCLFPPETFYPQTWVDVGKNNRFDAKKFPNSYMRQLGYTTNKYTDQDV